MNYSKLFNFFVITIISSTLALSSNSAHAIEDLAATNAVAATSDADVEEGSLLDFFKVKPEEKVDVRTSFGKVVLKTLTAGAALIALTPDRKYISASFSPGKTQTKEYLEALERTLRSFKENNPGAKFRHGFGPGYFLDARGFSHDVKNVIDSVFPGKQQIMMFDLSVTAEQWKNMPSKEFGERMTDMRTRYINSVADSGPNAKVWFLGEITGGVEEEMKLYNKNGVAYTHIQNVGDKVHLSDRAKQRARASSFRNIVRKGTKLATVVVGVIYIAKDGYRVYYGLTDDEVYNEEIPQTAFVD